MIFLLQDESELDIDVKILDESIRKQRGIHSRTYIDLEGLHQNVETYLKNTVKTRIVKKGIIPVGSIEFVKEYLRIYGISELNPIEVPKALQTKEFLKRDYSIVSYKEIPKDGNYFIKDVSKLKQFSFSGNMDSLFQNYSDKLNDSHLYQVSENVEIVSEYRCFIHNDKIVCINHYDGDPTIFPDISTLNKMICMYMFDKERPKAYSLDIAIIKDKGTAVIEVHPWVSVGLYSYLFGSDLPYCYADGLQYYLDYNKPIETCEIKVK